MNAPTNLTIRLRLTLLYAALFTITSAALILTAYLFVNGGAVGPERIQRDRMLIAEAFDAAGIEQVGEFGRVGGQRGAGNGGLPDEVSAALVELTNDARDDVLAELLTRSLLAFALTAGGSILLAWWVAGRALAPVDAITAAANQLSVQNLHDRLPDTGPDDELRRLRRSFNAMLDRLEAGFESQRRFAADASHELRTPFAVLRARADNVLSGADTSTKTAFASDVCAEVDRAEHLVSALLALARAEQPIEYRPIDVAEMVGDVVGDLAPLADQHSIDVRLALAEGSTSGDVALVTSMVRNLVRNGIVHNIDGGLLDVEVVNEGTEVLLRFENSGQLLDADEVETLFQRFRRGREAADRHGHGLGLAIVDAVAVAHGFDLRAEPRPGGGLRIEVAMTSEGPMWTRA